MYRGWCRLMPRWSIVATRSSETLQQHFHRGVRAGDGLDHPAGVFDVVRRPVPRKDVAFAGLGRRQVLGPAVRPGDDRRRAPGRDRKRLEFVDGLRPGWLGQTSACIPAWKAS